jgi:uncharacterized protein (DUF934 family)
MRQLTCQCGEPAIVAVRENDEWKYATDPVTPDLRRRTLLCLECWCKWEAEFGDKRMAGAVAVS